MCNKNNGNIEITLTQSVSLPGNETMVMCNKQILELSNQDEVIYLRPEQILYVQADGNYCDIHLADGDVLETVGFQRAEVARRIESQLPCEVSQRFALVGKPYLINITHVMRINASRQQLTFNINQPGTCKKQTVKASATALRTLRQRIDEPQPTLPQRIKSCRTGGFADYRELACAEERNYEIGDDEVMILGR